MEKSSSTSTTSQGYNAPKQRFNRPHFQKPYATAHGQFATQKTNSQRHFLANSQAPRGAHTKQHSPIQMEQWKTRWENKSHLLWMQICYPSWILKQVVLRTIQQTGNQSLLILLFVMPSSIIMWSFRGTVDLRRLLNPDQLFFLFGNKEIISLEIAKLLNKGVIEQSKPCDGDFISTILVRPKKDGSHRLILNVKPLYEFVAYYHFKMDTIHAALKLMWPGCFMASVDLKDSYYITLFQ